MMEHEDLAEDAVVEYKRTESYSLLIFLLNLNCFGSKGTKMQNIDKSSEKRIEKDDDGIDMDEGSKISEPVVEEAEEVGDYNRECIVGMTQYSTSGKGFKGKIKVYPSDFIVQEISETEEVLPLKFNENESPFGFEQENKVPFTKFILKKVGIDTLMAAGIIANYLNIPLRDVTWAGIKDGRAITSQYFCVKGNYYSQLKQFQHPNINLYRFRPTKKPITIGDLWGNYFEIKIKCLEKPLSELRSLIDEWSKEIKIVGAPNYYGLQRFGFYRPNSHLIGKYIFLKEYEKAVEELLFRPYAYEDAEIIKIRQKLSETRDYGSQKNKFHPKMQYERILCEYLESHPTDYKNAILSLPFPFRNLLLSSYQSYLFNLALSKRIEKGFPIHKPLEGDIVAVLKSINGPPSNVRYEYKDPEKEKLDAAMRFGRISILAPVLGSDSKLDDFGIFGPIYKEILDKEGIEPSFFRITDFKAGSFRGTYRSICIKMTDLQVEYKENADHQEEEYVELKFKLPKGSYATVVLRELLKLR
jgi:tRNA pseudouridine13 synthase